MRASVTDTIPIARKKLDASSGEDAQMDFWRAAVRRVYLLL
jgi:hypothetical protein